MYKNSVPRYIHCASGIVHNRTKIKRTRARRNNEKKKKKKKNPVNKVPLQKKNLQIPRRNATEPAYPVARGRSPHQKFHFTRPPEQTHNFGSGVEVALYEKFPGGIKGLEGAAGPPCNIPPAIIPVSPDYSRGVYEVTEPSCHARAIMKRERNFFFSLFFSLSLRLFVTFIYTRVH